MPYCIAETTNIQTMPLLSAGVGHENLPQASCLCPDVTRKVVRPHHGHRAPQTATVSLAAKWLPQPASRCGSPPPPLTSIKGKGTPEIMSPFLKCFEVDVLPWNLE